MYVVENDWKLEVRVEENGHNTRVMRIFDDEREEELNPRNVRRYRLNYRGITLGDVREGTEIVTNISEIIK